MSDKIRKESEEDGFLEDEVVNEAVDFKSAPFLTSQSSQPPQEDNFSMSRSEDLANSEVYGPKSSRSATGLSVAFPGCKVTESKDVTAQQFNPSSSEPAWSQNPPGHPPFSSSAPAIKMDRQVSQDSNNNDDVPSDSVPAMNDSSSQPSYQYLEDAQGLEPSQDPQQFSDPPYHFAQASVTVSQNVVLGASNLADIRLIRCLQGHSPTSSEYREKMEIEGMEADAASGSRSREGAYVPPNQLALLPSQDNHRSSSFSSPGKRFKSDSCQPFSLKGATAISPPPGPLSVRITSALGRFSHSGPVLELTKNGEAGFVPHDFPWDEPDLVVDPDPSPEDLGGTRFISVKEMASFPAGGRRTVVRDETIPFLLLVKDGDDLYIPTPSFFDRAMTKMEIHVLVKHPHLRSFFWSCSKWMGCGVVELSSEDGIEDWRTALTSLPLGGSLTLDTFPKDSLLMGPDITALLKEAHLEYDIKWMSHCLVYRNKQLKGNVRVVCSKIYQAHDITRLSVSMNGWQMVYLSGDCIFMESLSRFPVTHRFEVGPSSVILRGGIRKPFFLSEQSRAQFTWFKSTADIAPPLSLQPVQGMVPTSSDPALTRSSSSSSAPTISGPSIPDPAPLVVKKSSSRKQTVAKKSTPSSSPLPSGSGVVAAASKPKNRSQRLKARSAKLKTCC